VIQGQPLIPRREKGTHKGENQKFGERRIPNLIPREGSGGMLNAVTKERPERAKWTARKWLKVREKDRGGMIWGNQLNL